MKSRHLLKTSLCIYLTLLIAASGALGCFAENTAFSDNPRVLFLSSYSYEWESIPKQLDGISSVLDGRAKVDYVFMDTKRLAYEDVKDGVYARVSLFKQSDGFDYVITGGDAALKFVLEYRDELFSGVPVVFEGINDVDFAQSAAEDELITGIVEMFPLCETIELAAAVNPKATRVVAITDDSISGLGSTKQFYACEDGFPELEFSTINCAELTLEQIKTEVGSCGNDTILIFLMMSCDVNGNQFSSSESAVIVSSCANVPVYKADELGMRFGILGGVMVSYKDMAAAAAEIVLRLKDGEAISFFPVTPAAYHCVFDSAIMTRYGISKNTISSVYKNISESRVLSAGVTGSVGLTSSERVVFINSKPSFFEAHKSVLIPSGIAILMLIIMVIFSMIIIRKKRRLAKRLSEKETLFRNVLDNMSCGIVKVQLNADGSSKPVFINKAFLSLTRMSYDECMKLYGSDSCAGVHPDDLERVKKVMSGMSPGDEVTDEFRLSRGAGDWVWVRAIASVREDNGQLYLYNSYIDINDAKEKTFMVESLLDNLPGGVAVFKGSKRIECEYFHDNLAKLFGYTHQEFQEINESGNFFFTAVYPPDMLRSYEKIRELLKTGQPINMTYRSLRKDGSIIWVTFSAKILRYEDGTPIYYCVITTPPEETALYQSIVEDSTTAVIIAERSAARRIIYINSSMRSIYSFPDADSLTGKNLLDIIPESDLLLNGEEIAELSENEISEFHRIYGDKCYNIHGKAINWNSADAYILYVSDETAEYEKTRRQQELINRVPTGLGIYDVINGVVRQSYLNDSFYRMMRYTRETHEEKLQGNFMLGVHPDDIDTVKKLIVKVSSGVDAAYAEFRNLRGDGSYLWVRLAVSVVSRDGKNFTAYCGYEDYSETFEAKRLLEQSNEDLQEQYERELARRKLLEKDSAVTARFNVTKDRLTEYCSNRPDYQKYPSDMNGEEILSELLQRVPEGKERELSKIYFNTLRNPDTVKSGITEWTHEYRSRQSSGCLRWMRSFCRLEKDKPSGDIIAYIFVRDIDDEKKHSLAAESLIDEGTDYVLLFSAINGRTKLLRLKNSYEDDYKHLHKVFDFEQLTEDDSLRHVVPDDVEAVKGFFNRETLLKRLEKESVVTVIYRTFHNDGTLRRKKTRAFYLDETREDIVIARRDITDLYEEEQEQKRVLQKALDEAKSANRAKTTFLANMSHEIRTPMNAIIGMTELAEDATREEETRNSLHIIKDSGRYLLSILNDVLDMSRIENGKFTLNCQWVSPLKVLEPCLQMIIPAIRAKHIEFSPPKLDAVQRYEYYVDVLKTQRMLMNLLNNACKFTPGGGHISLSFRNKYHDDDSSTDLITVEDDGCGMSEEFLSRIFTPFAQELNAYSDSVQGTGLGLVLARQTARAMGGDITVESELGVGSKFTIIFPYRYRHAKEKDEASVPAVEEFSGRLSGARVLLVEDNKLNTLIAKRLLEKVGCAVDTLENGKAGVDGFAASAPGYYNAILMDIHMPVMDGLAASGAIRALDRADAKTVPIIAMSANAFDEDVLISLQAGMNAHLGKPIDSRKLYSTLCEQLGR